MISFRAIFLVVLAILVGAHGAGLANEPKGEAKFSSAATRRGQAE